MMTLGIDPGGVTGLATIDTITRKVELWDVDPWQVRFDSTLQTVGSGIDAVASEMSDVPGRQTNAALSEMVGAVIAEVKFARTFDTAPKKTLLQKRISCQEWRKAVYGPKTYARIMNSAKLATAFSKQVKAAKKRQATTALEEAKPFKDTAIFTAKSLLSGLNVAIGSDHCAEAFLVAYYYLMKQAKFDWRKMR